MDGEWRNEKEYSTVAVERGEADLPDNLSLRNRVQQMFSFSMDLTALIRF